MWREQFCSEKCLAGPVCSLVRLQSWTLSDWFTLPFFLLHEHYCFAPTAYFLKNRKYCYLFSFFFLVQTFQFISTSCWLLIQFWILQLLHCFYCQHPGQSQHPRICSCFSFVLPVSFLSPTVYSSTFSYWEATVSLLQCRSWQPLALSPLLASCSTLD